MFDTQAAAILHFYRNLRPRFPLGEGIGMMNPYKDPAARAVATQFYEKFYADNRPRAFIFGINPGRHGAGVTGVPFTDPIRLVEKCGIPNDWKQQAELSSQFVYAVIDALWQGERPFTGGTILQHCRRWVLSGTEKTSTIMTTRN